MVGLDRMRRYRKGGGVDGGVGVEVASSRIDIVRGELDTIFLYMCLC